MNTFLRQYVSKCVSEAADYAITQVSQPNVVKKPLMSQAKKNFLSRRISIIAA
jgi:hypothetical protein